VPAAKAVSCVGACASSCSPTIICSVKGIPGTIQDGGATFATTHWSVVAACADDSEVASQALAQLCRDYWPPLYTFARRRGYSPADAQDIVQGFFAYLLQSKAYARTDRTKGKFRSFLLASLKNYMSDVWDRERALKRGGDYEFVLLDDEIDAVEVGYSLEAAAMTLTEEQQYERTWAAALVARALERIRAEFNNGPKAHLFGALKPFLTGGVGLPSHESIAGQLDMPIDTLRSHLARLRGRYRDFVREEVARTIGPADDVDEELRHLRKVLVASS
jgi:RNA polymerase sigma factor (sigma-70 family)